MKVVELLKSKDVTLKGLKEILKLKVIEEDEGRVLLTYDHFESPRNSHIVKECRGLILDKDFNILSRPFERFFNLGEPEATPIKNFKKCTFVEKADGSLIKLWYDFDKEKWQIATAKRMYANSICSSFGLTFKEIFLKVLTLKETEIEEAFKTFNKQSTHMFELVSFYNKVVTPYKEESVYYLKSRNNLTGIYYEEDLTGLFIKKPKEYSFNSIEEAVSFTDTFENLEEGFIVYEDNIPILKIKSKEYVKAHLLKGEELSVKRIINLFLAGETEEYLSYFPEHSQLFQEVSLKYNGLKEYIEKLEERYKEHSLEYIYKKTNLTSLQKSALASYRFNRSFEKMFENIPIRKQKMMLEKGSKYFE